ncbi:tubulin-specific chaperone c protein [Mucor ambiguus]|uniref:Tubulin-specific chaperone c protein n=1 Tax=Mucor ambiguus TaxID=91626 RepID=A0A0C9N3H6_9FUNG|nr:tubulin-specific chaperone c protein [Mucor ambiguus]
MAEKTATEASNDFWLEFKAEKQAIEDELNNLKTLSKTELPNRFNNILQNINNLEKKLTKATAFIPSYDERQFSIQLKELSETLERNKAELTPKAKFSFKSRKKKPSAPEISNTSSTSQAPLASKDGDILSEATVLFKDKEDAVLTLSDANKSSANDKSIDILISNVKNCVVILQENGIQISAVHIKNIENSVVYCGEIEGSVLMYGLKNSVLFAGCHQFRMHEARNVDMMLHVTSRPIIEDSNNIQVCEWNIINQTSTNHFDQIEDFNWLKKQASPNWKVMDQNKKQMLDEHIKIFQQNIDRNTVLPVGLALLPNPCGKSE